jgi:hypothetical protein
MPQKIVLLAFCCASMLSRLVGQAIQVNPENPHYYLFHGKPTILITSAEHYGSVVNKAFNYVAYLDTLKAYGLNYTRIYPGAMFETTDKWITGNPDGPRAQDLILPWARSDQPGYINGGNKFDLDHWNPDYFARLKDFLAKAAERGVVVEICFFNSQYMDTWPISPLYYKNNIQGVGKCGWMDAQALDCGNLTAREADYVREIAREVNSFDNVILEICDECASVATGADRAGPWVSRMLQAARDAERDLPNKHLVAQEVEGFFAGPMDFSSDPRLSIITAQYIWGPDPTEHRGEMGGMRGLDYKYGINKPIEMNETDWYPIWYTGNKIADARVEAWEFIVGGGAGLNNLNGMFTAEDPAGKTPDNQEILQSLHNLMDFMGSFHFLKMKPDSDFIVSGLASADAHYRVISEPGRQYAMYLHHSEYKDDRKTSYVVKPGNYQEKIVVQLTAGPYKIEWIDPATAAILATETLHHRGGYYVLSTPPYTVDIALRIKRQE